MSQPLRRAMPTPVQHETLRVRESAACNLQHVLTIA
jgi:hypothetical protein